jgi:hypothetical protein
LIQQMVYLRANYEVGAARPGLNLGNLVALQQGDPHGGALRADLQGRPGTYTNFLAAITHS